MRPCRSVGNNQEEQIKEQLFYRVLDSKSLRKHADERSSQLWRFELDPSLSDSNLMQ